MKKQMAFRYFSMTKDLVVLCCTCVFLVSCVFGAQYRLIAAHAVVPPEIEKKMLVEGGVAGAAVRIAKVDLSGRISAQNGFIDGDELILNLFDDARYTARIERVFINRQGTRIIRGRLASFESGYFLISSTSGQALAHIRIPEKQREYVIFFDAETAAHYLIEIYPARKDILPGGPPLAPSDDENGDNQGG